MRYLKLDPELYSIFYSNILNAGQGFDKKEIRVIDKLLTKVESLGNVDGNGGYSLDTKEEGTILEVEDAEYAIMDRINNGIKFNPRFARLTVKYLDWFDNASTKPLRLEASEPAPRSTEG